MSSSDSVGEHEGSSMLKTTTPQSYTIQRENYSTFTVIGCILLTIFAGMLHPTQAGLNILLMYELNDQALRSSFISFTVGSLSLIPFLFYNCVDDTIPKCSNLFNQLNLNKIEYALFLNGFLGAFYVTSVIYVGPIIGLALYFICVVAGQMIFSTILDWHDASHTWRSHLFRMIGIFVLVSGVIICEIDSINNGSSGRQWYETVGYCIVGMFAGFAAVTRAFMNRRFEYHLRSSYFAAIPNFIGGAIICLVCALIQWAILSDSLFSDNAYLGTSNLYIWFGGILGAIYLVIVSIVMPGYIGYVASYICAICGNLIMSTIYDTIGLFGTTQVLSSLRVLGIALVFVAVIGVNVPQILRQNSTTEEQSTKEDETLPLKGEESNKSYDGLVQL